MPSDVRVQLINDLADIEYASISLFSFLSSFIILFFKNMYDLQNNDHHTRLILIVTHKTEGLKNWGFLFRG